MGGSELPVERIEIDQLVVGPNGAYHPGIEHDDAVGQGYGGEPVRDDQHGGLPGDIGDGFAQCQLVERVELRGRFVQQQEPWFAQEGARDGDALALTTGKRQPSMAHRGIQTIRQAAQEPHQPGAFHRFEDLGIGHVGRGETQVVAQRSRQDR